MGTCNTYNASLISKMGSVSILVKCGFVQMCCAVSLLLLKILGFNNVGLEETLDLRYTLHQDHRGKTQITWESDFQNRATVIPLVHVDIAAIVQYAVTGILLMCLSSRTKNFCLILFVNISTLLSLFAASVFTIFALLAILSHSRHQLLNDSRDDPAILLQAIVVLVNSLVMLLATIPSTTEIWQISFYSKNAATERLTTLSVRGSRSVTTTLSSGLEVAVEMDTAGSSGDDFFQYFTNDDSEEEQSGEAPPPYHIATGKIPCKHCGFMAENKNGFVEHFQIRPDHWSCLVCKKRFSQTHCQETMQPVQ